MLLLMMAGLALAPDVTAVHETALKPIGDPGEWITPDDYPKSALMAGVEGVTGFRLFVDKTGNVADCLVVTSSGNEGLDAVACALLRDRAHFSPARDGKGVPVPSTYASAVRWQIPAGDPFPLKAFSASLSFDVNAMGATSGCQVQGGLPEGASLDELCQAIIHKASFEPFRAADGTARPKHVVVRFSLDLSDPVAQPVPVAHGKGS